jgi:hypothetical protein
LIAFGGKAWRNGVIAIVAGAIWYRADQHITHSGDVSWISCKNRKGINKYIGEAPFHSLDRISHEPIWWEWSR